MSFLFPNSTHWSPAKWVSLGFFADCINHLGEAPHLADDVRFCIDAEVETIDLRGANAGKLRELKRLVERVLADSFSSRGNSFYQPEAFPVYLQHLQKLDTLVNEAIRDSQ